MKNETKSWFKEVGRPRLKAILGSDYDYLISECSHMEYEESVKDWPCITVTRKNKKTGKYEHHIYNVQSITKEEGKRWTATR